MASITASLLEGRNIPVNTAAIGPNTLAYLPTAASAGKLFYKFGRSEIA